MRAGARGTCWGTQPARRAGAPRCIACRGWAAAAAGWRWCCARTRAPRTCSLACCRCIGGLLTPTVLLARTQSAMCLDMGAAIGLSDRHVVPFRGCLHFASCEGKPVCCRKGHMFLLVILLTLICRDANLCHVLKALLWAAGSHPPADAGRVSGQQRGCAPRALQALLGPTQARRRRPCTPKQRSAVQHLPRWKTRPCCSRPLARRGRACAAASTLARWMRRWRAATPLRASRFARAALGSRTCAGRQLA